MPQIMVKADKNGEREETVMLRERVTASDLESDHFAAQLIERLGWAVADAHEIEHAARGTVDESEEAGESAEVYASGEVYASASSALASRLALVGA